MNFNDDQGDSCQGCTGVEALTSLMHITPSLHELRTFSSAARADSIQMVDSLCVCVAQIRTAALEILHKDMDTQLRQFPHPHIFPFMSPMKN